MPNAGGSSFNARIGIDISSSRSHSRGSLRDCLKADSSRGNSEGQVARGVGISDSILVDVAFVAFVPIILGWLLAWICIRVTRWVMRGAPSGSA
jgi:hypothetical protein